MQVSEVMTAQVSTASPRTTIAEVARTMAQVESGAVPVVDDGRVVGLITDRDIVLRVVAEGKGLDTAVSEVMTEGVETCHPAAPLRGTKSGSMRKRVAGSLPHHPARRGSEASRPWRSCTNAPPGPPGPALTYL